MGLSVALQMDPPHTINIDGDSSFALGLEAQRRGHQLYYYHPSQLALKQGILQAPLQSLVFRREKQNHCDLGTAELCPLSSMRVILLRQDPPFNMAYLTNTWLLDHAMKTSLVVNNPQSVRDCPEKLLITHFPQLLPPTLISRNQSEIKEFYREHQEIVVKPLYGNGGYGIFHLRPEDPNLDSLLEIFFQNSPEPLMFQAFLKAVRQGDKRILLADGEFCGAINRVPPQGQSRSNMHVGGRPEPTQITKRDKEIIETIGPVLKAKGLIFAGIDVIGDYLTEINVTSPTGIQEAARFSGINPAIAIWDAIEARL